VNGAAGSSAADLPASTPVLVVRAGRDQFAGVNDALDRFVLAAWRRDLPVTCVNHAAAPHAFDLECDDAASRAVIRQVLSFVTTHLVTPGAE